MWMDTFRRRTAWNAHANARQYAAPADPWRFVPVDPAAVDRFRTVSLLWAFRRLYEYVAYKAREQGIEAVQVDPRNTSKRCSTCGFTHDDNRHGEDFECLDCGYQNHADYNASKNIGLQYLRRPQKSSISGVRTRRFASRQRRQNADDGGAPVDVRLNRGTLNVSGEYDLPASSEA